LLPLVDSFSKAPFDTLALQLDLPGTLVLSGFDCKNARAPSKIWREGEPAESQARAKRYNDSAAFERDPLRVCSAS